MTLWAAARTMLWPKSLIGWGVFCIAGLTLFYVRPYQAATGQLVEGGPFIVWSGELLIALVFGGLITSGGLLAHWAIKRFYASGV